MNRRAYAEFSGDNQTLARQAEFEALDIVVKRLTAARDAGAAGAALDEALDSTEALWAIFMQDVVSPENGLPRELRKNIVSIGQWVFARTNALRNAGEPGIDALIEVNTAIRDGMKAQS